MRYTITISFLLLFQVHSFAQMLNIEKYRVLNDTLSHWYIDASAGGYFKEQEKVAISAFGETQFYYTHNKLAYLMVGEFEYESVSGDNFWEEGLLHGRINFNRKQKFSYELVGQAQTDLGRGLKNRYFIGGDIRYNFLENQNLEVYAASGLIHEWQSWIVALDSDEYLEADAASFKMNNYLAFRASKNKKFSFSAVSYLQFPFSDMDDTRIVFDGTMQLKVKKNCGIKFRYTLIHELKPISPYARRNQYFKAMVYYNFI